MIGLIQRVSGAEVAINGTIVAKIGTGLLVLAGIERHDGPEQAVKLAARLVAYRVFADAAGYKWYPDEPATESFGVSLF